MDDKQKEQHLQTAVEKIGPNNSKLFEILGNRIETRGEYIIISGHAVLKNKEAYIIADTIHYNNNRRYARIIGNVRIYRGNKLSIYTEQATIYLNANFSIIQPFYIQDATSGIWTNAKSASHHKSTYRFSKSMVSGCSFVSPAWRIDSSRGNYDQEKNILSLWNPRIYIGDIPVFYFPYLRFSLENKRTSGFLYPTIGNSSTDGAIYIQPYYIALQDFWDVTISPQVRTSRGYGVNLQLRAIDSSNDKYIFVTRYFYNTNSYIQKFNLLNQHIYGFDFRHSKRNILQKYFGLQSFIDNAVYIDLAYTNDIDYMRLDSLHYTLNLPFHTSKLNLYAQTNEQYFGLNLRYFISLNATNDDKTFQNLPNLQYHKYLNSIFRKEFVYSIDYQMKHAYRLQGYSYASNEIAIPLGAQLSLLNKYISLGFWIRAYAGNIYAYNNKDTKIFSSENTLSKMDESIGNYANLNYKISLNSDIGRSYKNLFHSMQTSIIFYSPIDVATFSNGNISSNILRNFTNLSPEIQNSIQNGENIWDPTYFTNIYELRRRIEMNISNYFYNSKGKELLYWRITQIFNLNDKESAIKLPMENKLGISPLNGLFLNFSFFYSWFYSGFTELALSATYSKGYYAASISYYLKRDDAQWSLDPNTLNYRPTDSSNYINASIKGDVGYVGIVANMSYDFRSNILVNLGVGIYKDIKCFGIGIKVGSERTPILTQNNNINVINNLYAKVEFKFVPLTNFGYTYKLRPIVEDEQTNK
ncbi:LPS-assembly protein LptD [Helicobacter muridarum]|uniref:LPS-assembly protein LptD n=1 Tax=Helicobacter muridarum TaxID=216 RepID=A0A4U8TN38_9HELI|nr:LPS-assembly protein LptD [Helicobacter muridarum]